MSDKRKNSQRNKKKTSKKSAYQGSEQLQDLDIEQQQVKMSNKNSSQELSKKQEASEMMIQMQIQSKELKSSPLYSKPYSRIKERQIQKVEVRKYLHENQDQSQNSKNFNNFESSHKIISNDSEVNIGYQYNDGYNNHIQPPKRQFNSLDSQLSSWGQIQSPKMQIPQRGNIITEVEKRPNEKATQLIKVQNINDKNYTDTRQKAIQTVRNILYLCSADPAEFKKFIPPPQIRQKVKTLLTTCEDKVNLYEIVSKQVQLANYEYQNCNNQKKPELELHLANYLNEQGNCLLDTGKYSEAIKAYQKCTPILEKSFNENCNKISQQNPSIFSRAKSWFSRSQNYERKQQRKSKAGDSFKTLSNKFPVLIDSLDSLTKCYDLVMNRQIKFDLVV